MLGRSLLLSAGSVLLVVALLGAGGDVAMAARAPVDIPGSLWLTQGLLKVAGQRESQFAVVDALVGFGAQPGLDGGEFGVNLDPDGLRLIILGTFFEKVPGKPVCSVDLQQLETELEDTLNLPPELELVLRSATFKVTPKSKQGVESIRAFLNIKLQVCGIDDRGRYRCANATLQYKGVGGRVEM